MSAVAHHLWLLLTFRHDLQGLPRRSTKLVAVFFIASAVVAMIRWQSPALALGHLLVVCLMAISFSPRLAVGYALLSVGIDLIALPVESYTGQRGGLVPFGAWECAGLFSMIVRSRD